MLLINNKYGYENCPISVNQNEKWVMYRVFIAQWGLLGAVLIVESDSSWKEGPTTPLLHL